MLDELSALGDGMLQAADKQLRDPLLDAKKECAYCGIRMCFKIVDTKLVPISARTLRAMATQQRRNRLVKTVSTRIL